MNSVHNFSFHECLKPGLVVKILCIYVVSFQGMKILRRIFTFFVHETCVGTLIKQAIVMMHEMVTIIFS